MNNYKKFYSYIFESYQPPYNINQIKKYYPDKASILLSDPVHLWRASTGIELIHKEPSLKELQRIWINWNKMPDDMKKKSDVQSQKIFGVDNATHYQQLMKSY